jgi:hypothetical protein
MSDLESIQGTYFDLLEESAAVQRCEPVDDTQFRIPEAILSENQIQVRCKRGWGPPILNDTELLLQDIRQFWSVNADPLREAIRASPASAVHVEDLRIEQSAVTYLPFFERLLVSDQFLQISEDYDSLDQVDDWRPFVLNVLKTAMRYLSLKSLFHGTDGRSLAVVFPASTTGNSPTKSVVTEASQKLAMIFLGEMFGREFVDFSEYLEFIASSPQALADPAHQETVFAKYGAEDHRGYRAALSEVVFRDLGSSWPQQGSLREYLAFDLFSRFREFERFGLDASGVVQQAEIPSGDRKLYDWWFATSARESSKALGLGYDESFLYKAAARSSGLAFLKGMKLPDVVAFRTENSAADLREQLRLARLRVQSGGDDLDAVIREVGDFMTRELDEFARDQGSRATARRRENSRFAVGFGASIGMTLASVVAPILSIGTLLIGKNLADLRASRHRHLEEEAGLRPLATLFEWRSRNVADAS